MAAMRFRPSELYVRIHGCSGAYVYAYTQYYRPAGRIVYSAGREHTATAFLTHERSPIGRRLAASSDVYRSRYMLTLLVVAIKPRRGVQYIGRPTGRTSVTEPAARCRYIMSGLHPCTYDAAGIIVPYYKTHTYKNAGREVLWVTYVHGPPGYNRRSRAAAGLERGAGTVPRPRACACACMHFNASCTIEGNLAVPPAPANVSFCVKR